MKKTIGLSRRALSVLLVLVMCLGMFQMPAFAADEDGSNAADTTTDVTETPKAPETSTETKPENTPAEKQESAEVTTPDKDDETEKSDGSNNNVEAKPEDKGGETETTVPDSKPEETDKTTETGKPEDKAPTENEGSETVEPDDETDETEKPQIPAEVIEFRALLGEMEALELTEDNAAEFQAMGDRLNVMLDKIMFLEYDGMDEDMLRYYDLTVKLGLAADMLASEYKLVRLKIDKNYATGIKVKVGDTVWDYNRKHSYTVEKVKVCTSYVGDHQIEVGGYFNNRDNFYFPKVTDLFYVKSGLVVNYISGDKGSGYSESGSTQVANQGSGGVVQNVTYSMKTCNHVGYTTTTTTKEPDCVNTGTKTTTCSKCGNVTTTTIPAKGHKWPAWTDDCGTHTDSNCTGHSRVCTVCKGSLTGGKEEHKDHTYGAWETVTEAKPGVPGEEKHTCTACGHYETKAIPALPAGPTDNGKGISIEKTLASIMRDTENVTKSGEAKAGDEVTWNITVTNLSNVEKTVTLNEKLAGAYFTGSNSVTLAPAGQDGCTKTVTASYTVKKTDVGTLTNTVEGETGKDGEDETATNDDVTVKKDAPNLTVEKTVLTPQKATYATGDYVTYQITVTNNGDAKAENVVITDELPSGKLHFESYRIGTGEAVKTEPANHQYSLGTIEAGKSASMTITARVVESIFTDNNPVTITNTATVNYKDKPDGVNPSDSVDITVEPQLKTRPLYIYKRFRGEANEDPTPTGIPQNFYFDYSYTDRDGNHTGQLQLSKAKVTTEGQGDVKNAVTYVWETPLQVKVMEGDKPVMITLTENNYKIGDDETKFVWQGAFYTFDGNTEKATGQVGVQYYAKATKVWIDNYYAPGSNPDGPTSPLTIVKSVDKDAVQAGGQVNYTINVTNTSSEAVQNVTVTDVLDSNLTPSTVHIERIKVDPLPADGVYNIGTVPAKSSVSMYITASVNKTTAPGTVINNQATLSDGQESNNVTVTVMPNPKLGVQVVCDTQSDHAASAWVLDRNVTVTVTENTNAATKDQYPYICTATMTPNQQEGWLVYKMPGSTTSWNQDHKLADSTKTLTATLYYDGKQWTLPTDNGMNADVVVTEKGYNSLVIHTLHKSEEPVKPESKLTIEKFVTDSDKKLVQTPITAQAGQQVYYTIKVTNTGSEAVQNVTVKDVLDNNLKFNSAAKTQGGTRAPITPDGGVYNIGTVDAKSSVVLNISAIVKPNTAPGTVIDNVATLSNGKQSNKVTVTVPSKYTVTYSWENAPSGQTLPTGGEYAEGTEVAVDGKFTSTTKVEVNGKTYEFSGWSTTDATITGGKFNMPSKPVTITGKWTVKGSGSDDSKPALTKIEKELVSVKVNSGEEITDFTNLSVEKGDTIVLRYKITITGDKDAKYTVTDPDATPVTTTGTLDESQKAEIYVTKTVTAGDVDTLTVENTAYVKPTDSTTDPIPGTTDPEPGHPSNKVTTEITVDDDDTPDEPTINDLAITKTANRNSVTVGGNVVYTITVTNSAETDATVTVTDTLPTGLTFVSAGNNGEYSNRTVTWSNVTVPANNRVELTVTATVNAAGTITNTAAVKLGNDTERDSETITGTTGGGGIIITPPDPGPGPGPDEPDDPVDIPDEPTPGGDQPDNPDDPGVDIPDEPVPGGDQPDLPDEPDDPGIDIPDEPVPGGDRPVIPTRPVTPTTPGLTDIPDEEVPLADTPETGDNVWVWYLTALLSAAGIAVLAVLENKKRAKH